MSACVTTWFAVQVIDAFGASEDPFAGLQDVNGSESVMVTLASVVFPVFVAVIVYAMGCPTALYDCVGLVFVIERAGFFVDGMSLSAQTFAALSAPSSTHA